MPYSPPSSTAVDFDFTTGTYSPPGSTSVNFDFGSSGPPPSAQESGVRRVNLLTQTSLFDPLWHPPQRTRSYSPIPQKARPILFSIT